MTFLRWKAVLLGLAACAVMTPIVAHAAPQRMLGKHIRVRTVQSIVTQPLGGGESTTAKITSEKVIYVSTAGRIFGRGNVSNSERSVVREQSPNNSSADDVTYRWQGDKLIGSSRPIVRTIAFDRSFQTCTTSFVLKPLATAWDADGKEWRILSIAENASCSIHDGNPFASQ